MKTNSREKVWILKYKLDSWYRSIKTFLAKPWLFVAMLFLLVFQIITNWWLVILGMLAILLALNEHLKMGGETSKKWSLFISGISLSIIGLLDILKIFEGNIIFATIKITSALLVLGVISLLGCFPEKNGKMPVVATALFVWLIIPKLIKSIFFEDNYIGIFLDTSRRILLIPVILSFVVALIAIFCIIKLSILEFNKLKDAIGLKDHITNLADKNIKNNYLVLTISLILWTSLCGYIFFQAQYSYHYPFDFNKQWGTHPSNEIEGDGQIYDCESKSGKEYFVSGDLVTCNANIKLKEGKNYDNLTPTLKGQIYNNTEIIQVTLSEEDSKIVYNDDSNKIQINSIRFILNENITDYNLYINNIPYFYKTRINSMSQEEYKAKRNTRLLFLLGILSVSFISAPAIVNNLKQILKKWED